VQWSQLNLVVLLLVVVVLVVWLLMLLVVMICCCCDSGSSSGCSISCAWILGSRYSFAQDCVAVACTREQLVLKSLKGFIVCTCQSTTSMFCAVCQQS
jgi:hypothetical protein